MSIPQKAGGAPVEDARALSAYLEAGCKPQADWRIGTEHEKFGFLKDTLAPLPYDGERSVRAVLQGMSERGWDRVEEDGIPVGLAHNGASVSLEPGGQFELSGAPLKTIHETCDEVHTHLHLVRQVADPLEVGFLGMGAAPTWSRADMPWMPKGRYQIMKRYMTEKGSLGHDMMLRTCTIQTNLDFGSEADMVLKLRVAMALQPIATALFANSPFLDGKPNGYESYRAHVWTDTDPDRTGILDFVFEDGFGFERWTDYALDVPMYFIYRDGVYHDVAGLSFRDFLAGELEGFPSEKPTLSDWADHLTTIFPEARIKKFLEVRGADGGPWGRICALPAFWVGLMYDAPSLAAAWDIAKGWTQAERKALRRDTAKHGLQATVGGRTVLDIARDLLVIAREGLKARAQELDLGEDETGYLAPLEAVVDCGASPARRLLDAYQGDWAGDISKIFTAEAF